MLGLNSEAAELKWKVSEEPDESDGRSTAWWLGRLFHLIAARCIREVKSAGLALLDAERENAGLT